MLTCHQIKLQLYLTNLMSSTTFCRNRKHSLQVLQTPFLANHALTDAADPTSSSNSIDSILRGNYLSQHLDTSRLNPTECQWISSLSMIIKDQIPLSLSIDDCKKFFQGQTRKNFFVPFRATYGILQNSLGVYMSKQPISS